ncbi:MAG: M23 family metallopeptidase [Flavobacteriaceae bacterium]|nr:M23 family metallopeptidase [Flavobacteriaceae bacterium]
MKQKENTSQKFKRKLLSKYRMVILNEETFEEQFYIRLTRFNVIVISILLISLFIIGTIFLVAYSPIKEYIPGYPSTELRLNAAKNSLRLDSIKIAMDKATLKMESLRKVLDGKIESDDLEKEMIVEDKKDLEAIKTLKKETDDSLLREMVYEEDKYNFIGELTSKVDFVLFPPAKGNISQNFNSDEKHFGVDIVLAENVPIKSISEGAVIFSEWSAETGYVIIIKHPYGLISVYKHNSALSKDQGDLVETGEVIATAGNTGEYSTGWHLHFELWSEGYPINPTNFIDFKLD